MKHIDSIGVGGMMDKNPMMMNYMIPFRIYRLRMLVQRERL